MPTRAVIKGIGHAVPPKILTNQDLERLVDTNDEWITQRTGIKERRICGPDETSSTLSVEAARKALQMADVDPANLDMTSFAPSISLRTLGLARTSFRVTERGPSTSTGCSMM